MIKKQKIIDCDMTKIKSSNDFKPFTPFLMYISFNVSGQAGAVTSYIFDFLKSF